MNDEIRFYKTKEPYGFLNNYYHARMFVYGRWWNWVEAPYQAQKTFFTAEYEAIHQAKTANEARLLGQTVHIRQRWDEICKRQVMKECCLAKFLQHRDLRKQLLETGTAKIIENSPIDFYWGCGNDDTGLNVLGQILMEIRQELRGE